MQWEAYNTNTYCIQLANGSYANAPQGQAAQPPQCPCNPDIQNNVLKYVYVFIGIAAGTFIADIMQVHPIWDVHIHVPPLSASTRVEG